MKKIIQLSFIVLLTAGLFSSCKKKDKKTTLSGTTWVHKYISGADTLHFISDTKVRAYGSGALGIGVYDGTGTYHYDKPDISLDVSVSKAKSGTVKGDEMTLTDGDKFMPTTVVFKKI